MKHLIFAIVGCVLTFQLSAQDLDTAKLNAAFLTAKKQHAPDKRSVHFTLTYKQDTAVIETSSSEALTAFNKAFENSNSLKIQKILLPNASLKGKIYGVSNLSVANNRLNPSHPAELVTQMLLGTPVEILKKQGSFYYIRTPEGYLSWVDGASIKDMTADEFNQWKQSDKLIVSVDYGHVFTEPNIGSGRVSDIVSGNILKNVGSAGQFYKVEFPDKRIGYIEKSNVEPYIKWAGKPIPSADHILKAAHKFIGVPYLWGGTSIKGMDCSGFTKTAFFLNGIILPRDASQQALVGTPIDVMTNNDFDVEKSLKNLLPGDLLFFAASKRNGIIGGRITHVAIYMGEGKFIQSAGMVKVSSIISNEADFDTSVSTIVSARRVLDSVGKPEITKVENHGWYK